MVDTSLKLCAVNSIGAEKVSKVDHGPKHRSASQILESNIEILYCQKDDLFLGVENCLPPTIEKNTGGSLESIK